MWSHHILILLLEKNNIYLYILIPLQNKLHEYLIIRFLIINFNGGKII